MLVPYTAVLKSDRLPWLTLLVAIFCLANHIAIQRNYNQVISAAEAYCASGPPVAARMAIQRIMGSADAENCVGLMDYLHWTPHPEQAIAEELAETAPYGGMDRAASRDYLVAALTRSYREFATRAPAYREPRYLHWPAEWDWMAMIRSDFGHGSWEHLVVNLFFFVAFAATVEIVIGGPAFVAVFIGSSWFTGAAYGLVSTAVGENVPALGLSGVVMTMIALLAYLLPGEKIRCFFWYLIAVGRIGLPVWLLALFFVGWDVYDLFAYDDHGSVNVLAHVTGAAFGYLVGVICFAKHKQRARESAVQVNLNRRLSLYNC